MKRAVDLLVTILSPGGLASLIVLAGVTAISLVWYQSSERRAQRTLWEEGSAHRPYFIDQTGAFGPQIRESSGVAVSRSQPGILWTHNDSGGAPDVYAVTITGRLVGQYTLRGARARDWEDIALGVCPDPGAPRSCLYVSDTGDNLRRRDTLHIYVIAEPTVDTTHPRPETVDVLLDIAFTYPDEPHDTETLGVMPDGDLLLVTKGRTGEVNAYRVSVGNAKAEYLATLAIEPRSRIGRLVTGGAVSADGRAAVIRTSTDLYFLDLQPGQPPVLTGRVCFLAGQSKTGEGVDFYDDSTLVLTGEAAGRTPGPIHLVRCN